MRKTIKLFDRVPVTFVRDLRKRFAGLPEVQAVCIEPAIRVSIVMFGGTPARNRARRAGTALALQYPDQTYYFEATDAEPEHSNLIYSRRQQAAKPPHRRKR